MVFLDASHCLCVNLTILQIGLFRYLCFTDEETEAQSN